MKKMKQVSIVGMGALGMLYGSMILEHMGADCISYLMDSTRLEKHKSESNMVNGKKVNFPKIDAKEARPCDLLIVAVKYTGLSDALELMRASVGPETMIISVMNGISSEEMIREKYPNNTVIDTVAQGMDAMHFGAELKYSKAGQLCVGISDLADQEKLVELTNFFDDAGIAYTVEKDIRYRMWSKFMLNVGINQTCMVFQTGYAGAMEKGSQAAVTLYGAMREVILLANAEGVHLTESDLITYINIVKTLDPGATPSMGQDRINKRPSEVELFAGTVIRMAAKHQIPVPANEFLYQQVQEIEKGYGA